MNITKAIIPAAGLGTRFLPYTKAMPKEMLNIVDKPAIQLNVEELVQSDIDDILIITARNKNSILNHFDVTPELDAVLARDGKEDLLRISEELAHLCHMQYVRQGLAKGLGHAVYCGRRFVGNEPFVVLLGDDVFYSEREAATAQLIKAYEKTGCSVIGVKEIPIAQSHKYGMVSGEFMEKGLMEMKHIVEKPSPEQSPSNLAVIGRYLLTPTIFQMLEKTPRGKGGEYQLTDAIALLLEQEKVFALKLDGIRYDVGDKLGYLQATVEYALRHPELKDSFREYLRTLEDEI